MFETAILVLLYNKEMSESNTINSLLESEVQYPNARLVIWNNGPEKLKDCGCDLLERLGYEVIIEETLNNESLAVIYNQFIKNNVAEKYILLDDDSQLTSEFIKKSQELNSAQLGMPIITFDGKGYYPTVNEVSIVSGELAELDRALPVLTIGSGLVIGNQVFAKLVDNYGAAFDERFFFYGVDITFCLRVHMLNLTDSICIIPGFSHQLSRLSNEIEEVSRFRLLERSYDFGLQLKYYHPFYIAWLRLVKRFLRELLNKSLNKPNEINVYFAFKAYITGKHYRVN